MEDENTIVVTGSAGTPLRILADAIDAINTKPDWQTLIIKPYYEKETNRRGWEGVSNVCPKTKQLILKEGHRVKVEQRLSTFLKYSPTTEEGIPRVIVMDHMPHYQSKITKE